MISVQTLILIEDERKYQQAKGATAEVDAKQTLGDFLVYLNVYLGKALAAYSGFPLEDAHRNARKFVVKVAAICCAFLDSHPE